jgi:hypothetical protein
MKHVIRSPVRSVACHWMLVILFGLLALGPFLHAHLGMSRVSGFHVAGYQTSGIAALAVDADHQLSESNDESPAVGVSASLPRFQDAPPCPDGITLQQLIAVLLLAAVVFTVVTGPSRQRPHRFRDRPGLPPPALAPPFSCA